MMKRLPGRLHRDGGHDVPSPPARSRGGTGRPTGPSVRPVTLRAGPLQPVRIGLMTALATAVGPLALAYGFALIFRSRVGFPARSLPTVTPADLGLPYEEIEVKGPSGLLPAWYVPAPGGVPGPGVVLVHGWGANRASLLPEAAYLHRCGFHCLLFDVRGHGANPVEHAPLTSVEFGEDAVAAVDALASRPAVRKIGTFGRSMGAGGAILAAAQDSRVRAVVSVSCPAAPVLLTRDVFRLARLRIPRLLIGPLAEFTTRVFVRPRGYPLGRTDPRRALERYLGPVLLAHGTADRVIAPTEVALLAEAARAARDALPSTGRVSDRVIEDRVPLVRQTVHPPTDVARAAGEPTDTDVNKGQDGRRGPVEIRLVLGGRHGDLTKSDRYRAHVAAFFTRWLDGPLTCAEAALIARSIAPSPSRLPLAGSPPRLPGPRERAIAPSNRRGRLYDVTRQFVSRVT